MLPHRPITFEMTHKQLNSTRQLGSALEILPKLYALVVVRRFNSIKGFQFARPGQVLATTSLKLLSMTLSIRKFRVPRSNGADEA